VIFPCVGRRGHVAAGSSSGADFAAGVNAGEKMHRRICVVQNVEVLAGRPYAFSISEKDLTDCRE
jgi:hypothetical protein